MTSPLYTVTVSPACEEAETFYVLAASELRAIRKALQALYGSAAAAPEGIHATAELTVPAVLH